MGVLSLDRSVGGRRGEGGREAVNSRCVGSEEKHNGNMALHSRKQLPSDTNRSWQDTGEEVAVTVLDTDIDRAAHTAQIAYTEHHNARKTSQGIRACVNHGTAHCCFKSSCRALVSTLTHHHFPYAKTRGTVSGEAINMCTRRAWVKNADEFERSRVTLWGEPT